MKVHLKDDSIMNPKTGEVKDIIVKTNSPVDGKDLLIGCGLMAAGLLYLLRKAFRNGCVEYNAAEFDALDSLGLLNNEEPNP